MFQARDGAQCSPIWRLTSNILLLSPITNASAFASVGNNFCYRITLIMSLHIVITPRHIPRLRNFASPGIPRCSCIMKAFLKVYPFQI